MFDMPVFPAAPFPPCRPPIAAAFTALFGPLCLFFAGAADDAESESESESDEEPLVVDVFPDDSSPEERSTVRSVVRHVGDEESMIHVGDEDSMIRPRVRRVV
jgi:hypothetical protein